MKTVLAPLDFSDATPRVVEEAARLAEALKGSLILLHVARVPEALPQHSTELVLLAEAVREIEALADRQLARIKEGLRTRGLPIQSLRVTGDAKNDIVQQAEKLDADYIVMGTHGHSALYDLAFGSVTSAVINRTNRVVVVVPPPPRRPPRSVDSVFVFDGSRSSQRKTRTP